MFPILQLGPFAVQLPGLFLLAGVWIGTWLVERTAPKYKLNAGTVSNMIFIALVAGIVGARLWYALHYIDVYLGDPISLLSLNPSTIAPLEGVLTGLLVALIYGQRKGLPLWPTLDALTLPFAVMAVSIGLANLSSGDAFGAPSELPWAIDLWGEARHPSQIYEILIGMAIFLVLYRLQHVNLAPGILFLSWAALAAGGQLFLEAFRGDSVIIFSSVRSAQVISLLILLAVMWGLRRLSIRDLSPEA
jgi:prolipoprotein diacylglyceryltransferase